MKRLLSLTAAVAVGLLVAASSASAADVQDAKKQKKKVTPAPVATAMVGTITKVSDDGKTFSVTALGGTKKLPPTTTEFKVTDRTNIEYVGIDTKEAQKLTAGFAVIVAFDAKDKETATVVKVARTEVPAKKRKKTDQ